MDNNEVDSILPKELLDGLPEEKKGQLLAIFKHTFIQNGNSSLSDKITSNHITDLIQSSDKQDTREKYFILAVILIVFIFIGFLVIVLKENKDILTTIIASILSFVAGYGFSNRFSK